MSRIFLSLNNKSLICFLNLLQVPFNAITNGYGTLDASLNGTLNANDYGTYGQIGTIQQIQAQPANLTNAWFDTDL